MQIEFKGGAADRFDKNETESPGEIRKSLDNAWWSSGQFVKNRSAQPMTRSAFLAGLL